MHFRSKIVQFYLNEVHYVIDYIHYIYQSCFRTGGSTTETPWFAVPEPYMALDRYKYSHIELISALYGRDYVFKAPGICYEIDIMYSRICLLSHAPRVQSAMSGHLHMKLFLLCSVIFAYGV